LCSANSVYFVKIIPGNILLHVKKEVKSEGLCKSLSKRSGYILVNKQREIGYWRFME